MTGFGRGPVRVRVSCWVLQPDVKMAPLRVRPSLLRIVRMRYVVQKRRIAVCTEAKALRVRAGHGSLSPKFVSTLNHFPAGALAAAPRTPRLGVVMKKAMN
jgi:hypothetical protein